jgi:pSer/pThr/pTyr-binding forkhead associated (FHA) protein
MPVTVVVRSSASGEARLTFDGTQRIVLGRGAGCDLRLPDATVSPRHASLRAQGADFVVLDEGSANGTYVGDVRVAPHTSRIVRTGDLVRLGRVWLELRVDRSPVTRDLAAATRDLALALVSEAMGAMGSDRTVKLQITEGQGQGETLELAEEGRAYVLGRGPECDLNLEDADASREHVRVVRRGITVLLRDLDTKNGTWLGQTRVAQDRDVPWKPGHVLQIGHTTIALQEPVGETLAEIEAAPDEVLPPGAVVAPPPATTATKAPARTTGRARLAETSPPSAAPVVVAEARASSPALAVAATRRSRSGWTPTDLTVMAAAIGVLALSIAGLYWLLRG